MIEPNLLFSMNLPINSQSKLVMGSLVMHHLDKDNSSVKLQATSGTARNQFIGSWNLKGKGCLPPTSDVIKYTTTTNKLWLPNVKGVEGSFYAIAPFSVKVRDIIRGDFGIHFDANVPGSAGCIVIPLQEHWDIFREKISLIRESGIQSIKLVVVYT